MSGTLIVLNPHAAGGRAGQVWARIEPLLWQELGELVVAVTHHPDEVAQHLHHAYASGLTRVISIGGDGTNHSLINALADLNARHPDGPKMVYGNLPIGTGYDWARGTGIPVNDLQAAARWIARAEPKPTDIGLVEFDGQREHFLNIASAGISSDVAARVNRSPVRQPWSFQLATVASILRYRPGNVRVTLDGQPWYDDKAYLVVVANGTTFGRGMRIAPNAQVRDGLFDVILVEAMSRLGLLTAFQQVYSASHLAHPAVRFARASHVHVHASEGVGLELDGETAAGSDLSFSVQPGLLPVLM